MVGDIEASLVLLLAAAVVVVVEDELLEINNHLRQLNVVYPKMKMRDLSYSEFDVITLVDSVGETIVVPFCK